MPDRVTGLNEALSNLDSTVKAIDAASREALIDTAYAGAHNASRRAPVETGRLRDSFVGAGRERDSLGPGGVRTGVERRGPFAEIGSLVEYAAKIEYTDKPMLRPASHQMETELVEATRQKVVRTLSRRIR
jgi:hypothetical protein